MYLQSQLGINSKIIQDPRGQGGYANFINSIIGTSIDQNKLAGVIEEINTNPTETFLIGIQGEDVENNDQILNSLYIVKKIRQNPNHTNNGSKYYWF